MIEFQLKNFDKLSKMADNYPSISEKGVNSAIFKILTGIKSQVKANAPYGVSPKHLRDVWDIEMSRFAGSLKSGVNYGYSVETGTRPHQVSAKALKQWAESKGLNPYAVAKSIAKKGTKANPFMQKTLGQVNDFADKILQETADEISENILKL